MSKGRRYSALLMAVCLIYAGYHSGAANACTLQANGFGGLIGVDCELFATRPEVQLQLPNLKPKEIDTFVWDAFVDLTVVAKNYGPVGTQGHFPVPIMILSERRGAFDVTAVVTARDLSGAAVTINGGNGWQTELVYIVRASQHVAPGAEVAFLLGSIQLPNLDVHYDLCVELTVDSYTTRNPGGEIWESSEQDNVGLFDERIFSPFAPPPVSNDTYCATD